jgi:hypothetical protein
MTNPISEGRVALQIEKVLQSVNGNRRVVLFRREDGFIGIRRL